MAGANARVGVTVDANSAGAVKGLKSVENALKGVNKQTKAANTFTGGIIRAQKAWQSVAGTFTAVAAGAVAVGAAVWTSVQAYAESEKFQIRLERSVINATGSYAKWDAVIQRTIASQSRLSAVDDELVSESLSKLVQMTGDVNDAMALNQIALDVSAGTGKDLISVSTMLGKVYAGNTSAAKRLGISLKDGATATEALGEIQKKYAGQAEAYGESVAGSADRMAIAWGNAQEVAGRFAVGVLKVDTVLNNASGVLDKAVEGQISLRDALVMAYDPLGIAAPLYATLTEEQNKTAASTEKLTLKTTSATTAYQQMSAALGTVNSALADSQDAELNSLRADERVKTAKKNLATAIKEHGKSSREARIAELELTQAKRDAATAAAKYQGAAARAKAATDAAKKAAAEYAAKLKLLKERANAAGDALDAMYGKGAGQATRDAANYGGTGNRASGSIERARAGGVQVRVAEAGSDEAIIPINNKNRSLALLGETMRRMGVPGGAGPIVINITGSKRDAQEIELAAKRALASVLG